MPRKKEVKESPTVKKTTTKKATAKQSVPKATTAARANKTTSTGKGLPSEDLCVSPEQVRMRINELAYYRYVSRGRVPGYDVADWIEAEKIVREQLGATNEV